jgi:hypothetical protein
MEGEEKRVQRAREILGRWGIGLDKEETDLPIIIKASDVASAFSAIDDTSSNNRHWGDIMLEMEETCPEYYNLAVEVGRGSTEKAVAIINFKNTQRIIFNKRMYDFGQMLAMILFPVYFANGGRWPIIRSEKVRKQYQLVARRYNNRPSVLWTDFMEKIGEVAGEWYREAVEEAIRAFRVYTIQRTTLALLVITFFELVPCSCYWEDK